MRPLRSLAAVAALAALAPLASRLRSRAADRTWDMLAVGLPDRISPKVASLNMGYYALKQTHEPILRLGSDGQYSSRVLASWERSPDSRRFHLCPKPGLRFGPGEPFDTPFLKRFLASALPRAGLKAGVVSAGACVDVSLAQGGAEFLESFSRMETAPSVPTEDARIEIGLGPFRAVSISTSEIVLTRKDPIPDGYNEVRMHNYRGRTDPLLQSRAVEDFNRAWIEDLPDWIKSDYANYGVALLQSESLLIDHPDLAVRRRIYHCTDVDKLRRALMPRQQTFQDIATILPLGMPGAERGRPRQRCDAAASGVGAPLLRFGDWKPGDGAELRSYFAGFEKSSGLKVSVAPVDMTTFVKNSYNPDRPWELSIIALDAVSPDYGAFFGLLAGDPEYIPRIRLKRVRRAYEDLQRARGDRAKAAAVARLNAILADEALVLPLYQEVRTFYYPRGLKGLNLGDNFLEYPEVGDIRL